MKREDWKKIRHFSMKEKFGNPLKMDMNFMETLDSFRDFLEYKFPCSFVITEGYNDGGHVEKSQHYLGKAVDGYLKANNNRINLETTYNLIKEFNKFNGIGLYRMNYHSQYIHLDTRDSNVVAKWGGLPNQFSNLGVDDSWLLLVHTIYGKSWDTFKVSGNTKYVPLDERFFRIVNDVYFWGFTK